MTVTKADLKQLAGQLRLAGELLEANGETAWSTMEGWEDGPRAANSDPKGGNRVDDDGIPISLNDTTGDAAVEGTLMVQEAPASLRFERLLEDLSLDSGALVDLLRAATPRMPKPDRQQVLDAGLITDGWCTSCFRDNGHLHPIALTAAGVPFYRGLCRWCGEFKAKNGTLPPLELLIPHHEGRRVTVPMVQRAMARVRKRKKKARR